MFKYILKQLRRSFITNALFCLLLTLAGTLLCISAGLWYSAHKALSDIDETITTIAIPDRVAINRLASDLIDERHMAEWESKLQAGLITKEQFALLSSDFIHQAEQEIFQTIREQIYPSGVFKMDERRFFNAFVEGVTPISMRLSGVGVEPYLAAHSGQALAAFVVTCSQINSEYMWTYDPDRNDGEGQSYIMNTHNARFTVNEVLLLHSVHIDPRYIRIDYTLNHDGSSPFEIGKQYIVFGNYERQIGMGMSELILELPSVEKKDKTTDMMRSNADLNELFNVRPGGHYHLDEGLFPIEVVEYKYEREPTADDGLYSFIEVINSLDETMNSEQGLFIKKAIENAEISAKSFQIITTNDPNSLLRFNQNRNLFDEGRTFLSREIRDGAHVCLISRQFADDNELSVGDVLPLQLYNSILGAIDVTYLLYEGGPYVTDQFWIPSIYHPDLELSDPIEYTITGIYNTLRIDRSEYAIPPNTVILPNNSFGTLAGEPVSKFDTSIRAPILLNSIIVPNGMIDEVRTSIDDIVPGYGSLFRFYDQGYDSLRTTLGNLRFGMTWILVLSAAGWIAVLFIFLLFYVARKRKEAIILYALGISRTGRFNWVFTQCVILILAALGISIAASLPVYSDILDIAGGAAQEFTDSFRNLTLSVAADSGLRSRIPLDRSPLALIVTVAGASAITLITAGILTSRAAAFKSLSEKRGDD